MVELSDFILSELMMVRVRDVLWSQYSETRTGRSPSAERDEVMSSKLLAKLGYELPLSSA